MEKWERIAEKPRPIFMVPIDIESSYIPHEIRDDLSRPIRKECRATGCRAVSIDRLETVLQRGIDVEPTNSVIWVNSLDKALEYGKWPKVLMVLDYKLMKRTWVELDADAPEEKIAAVRRDYPTLVNQGEGSRLFFSRLTRNNPQLYNGYEFDSAFWIPGDPWEALKGIFIFHRPKDHAEMENVRRQLMQTA